MSGQHFKKLLFRSTQIEREIRKEQKRPFPSWTRLLRLKKIRLKIKDRLYLMAQNALQKKESKALGAVIKRGRTSKPNRYAEST